MSDFKAKIHHIRFRLGLRPGPRYGSLQRSPRPLAGFKGSTSKGRGGEGKGGEGGEGYGGEERQKGGGKGQGRERERGQGDASKY